VTSRYKRFLPRAVPMSITVACLVLAFWGMPGVRPAQACWNILEMQCFDQNPRIVWPWAHPSNSGRTWRRAPQPPYTTWGYESDIYSTAMCPTNTQALWCIGYPPSNDPQFDYYPRNYGARLMYGPINLSAATAARATFYLFNRSETAHDSIFWGATTVENPTLLSQLEMSGVYSGIMLASWESRNIDFADLYNGQTLDSTSLLGQPTVYVFWWFISDNNTVVNVGAFIDNVTIAWDDGGVDIRAVSAMMMEPDSEGIQVPTYGDTIFAQFVWSTCSGGTGVYPPFRIMGRIDDTVVLDTLIANPVGGMSGFLYTQPWIVDTWGTHTLRIVVDTLDSVAEVDENNNAVTITYEVAPPNFPPTFIWITPSTDTVFADRETTLRWAAYDSLEEATLLFYYDSDTSDCNGVFFPNGRHMEQDGPDSLVWNTTTLPEGRVFWPQVRIMDAANDVCQYAPKPVVIHHVGPAGDPPSSAVPDRFYLAQNYPNPFNPATELRFGVAVAGPLRLSVHDLTGREIAVLVNEPRSPGHYTVRFDGSGLPTGLYFYTLTTREGTESRKMMLLK
jgi:hypothetical protein